MEGFRSAIDFDKWWGAYALGLLLFGIGLLSRAYIGESRGRKSKEVSLPRFIKEVENGYSCIAISIESLGLPY